MISECDTGLQARGGASTRFIICSVGSYGDIYPFLAIAKQLVARQYAVTFISSPVYEYWFAETGIEFIPYGTTEQFEAAANDPNIMHWKSGFQTLFEKVLMPNRLAVLDYAKTLPSNTDLIILAHPLTFAFADLAKSAKLKRVRVCPVFLAPPAAKPRFAPLSVGRFRYSNRLPNAALDLIWRMANKLLLDHFTVDPLNLDRVRLGLPEITHWIDHVQNDGEISLGLFPRWYTTEQYGWPKNFVGGAFVLQNAADGAIDNELSAFIEAGEKPILFTFGSENRHASEMLECAAKALKLDNKRGIFLFKRTSQLSVKSDHQIAVRQFSPLANLLPKCAAIVHHGGIGTLAQGVHSSVPQLIIPFAWDQGYNAKRITSLGLGLSLQPRNVKPRSLSRALVRLTGDARIQTAVKDYAALIRRDQSVGEIVDVLIASTVSSEKKQTGIALRQVIS